VGLPSQPWEVTSTHRVQACDVGHLSLSDVLDKASNNHFVLPGDIVRRGGPRASGALPFMAPSRFSHPQHPNSDSRAHLRLMPACPARGGLNEQGPPEARSVFVFRLPHPAQFRHQSGYSPTVSIFSRLTASCCRTVQGLTQPTDHPLHSALPTRDFPSTFVTIFPGHHFYGNSDKSFKYWET